MATNVPMPKLGLTMEEARIIEWLVPNGQAVDADEPILLIETDKTETEVGSPGSGVLHQLGQADEIFACGEKIAVLLAEGEEPPAVAAPAAPQPTSVAAAPVANAGPPPVAQPAHALAPLPANNGRLVASPNARRIAAEKGLELRSVRGSGPGGRIVSEDLDAAQPIGAAGSHLRTLQLPSRSQVVATAAARQLSDLLGVDLALVPADPRENRVTRNSVAMYVRTQLQLLSGAATPTSPAEVESKAPTPAPAPAPAATKLLQKPTETVRMSGMRGTIAKRMTASLQEMAQLTLAMDADMTAVLADRAARKQAVAAAGGGAVPSITDYIVAASAKALSQHPGMNAQVAGNEIALLPDIHVGLAVAVDNGLMVPVVTNTATRALADVAEETTRLAGAVRDGSISPDQLAGGTFSVSALGAFGVDMFTPVINPPNAGILGVGRLRDDLVLLDGQVTGVKKLTLSLTWDHRVLDGVPAAEFCRTIVNLLGDPASLD